MLNCHEDLAKPMKDKDNVRWYLNKSPIAKYLQAAGILECFSKVVPF